MGEDWIICDRAYIFVMGALWEVIIEEWVCIKRGGSFKCKVWQWRVILAKLRRSGALRRGERRRVGGPCGVTLRLAQRLSSTGARYISLSLPPLISGWEGGDEQHTAESPACASGKWRPPFIPLHLPLRMPFVLHVSVWKRQSTILTFLFFALVVIILLAHPFITPPVLDPPAQVLENPESAAAHHLLYFQSISEWRAEGLTSTMVAHTAGGGRMAKPTDMGSAPDPRAKASTPGPGRTALK